MGRKAITCYSAGSTRRPVSPRCPEIPWFTLHHTAGESYLFCPRAEIPAPPLCGNHYSAGVRKPALNSAQRLSAPHWDCRKAPMPQSKIRNSSPFAEGRKEVIGTKTRTLQGVTCQAHPSLRNTAGAPGRKKFKTPTTGAQGIKTLMKNK
jgi:hypothetical protein